MGITSWDDRRRLGQAMSLGGAEVRALELTSAYTVFANNGPRDPPVAITRIVDADGNEIETYPGAAGRAGRRPALRLHDHQHPVRPGTRGS